MVEDTLLRVKRIELSRLFRICDASNSGIRGFERKTNFSGERAAQTRAKKTVSNGRRTRQTPRTTERSFRFTTALLSNSRPRSTKKSLAHISNITPSAPLEPLPLLRHERAAQMRKAGWWPSCLGGHLATEEDARERRTGESRVQTNPSSHLVDGTHAPPPSRKHVAFEAANDPDAAVAGECGCLPWVFTTHLESKQDIASGAAPLVFFCCRARANETHTQTQLLIPQPPRARWPRSWRPFWSSSRRAPRRS